MPDSYSIIHLLASLLVTVIGIGILSLLIIYIIDTRQTKHTIRRNYPVIGRFRYWLEHMGKFLRQYFFAFDREEMPFNRAERSWVYRAAKNIGRTLAFGSTRRMHSTGTIIFINSPFPPPAPDAADKTGFEKQIGPDCPAPYTPKSIINISAMSYGAISKPAVQALALGAKMGQCWMNTGEGGLSDYHLAANTDLVFQIGTAKYGIRNAQGEICPTKLKTIAQYEQVKMFELKLSQGAKPGKGGILPAQKITEEIALIRGIPPFQASISPSYHKEISNNEELLEMLTFIRGITGKPTGFKAVISQPQWLADLFGLIRQKGPQFAPDFITVDGGDGGSGAAPASLMNSVGLPLKDSLPMLVDKLKEYDLKDRIKVIASGKLITPEKVAWALCIGADYVNSARGFMFALGCIQAMQCNNNNCPTGITTHNAELQKGLDVSDKAVRVRQYIENLHKEVSQIAHACGVARPGDLQRHHARIVLDNGLSVPLNEIYPDIRSY